MAAQHLNEAQQGPPSVSDAPLPVFAARPSGQTFKLRGSEPLLVVSDAATFTTWTQQGSALSAGLVVWSALASAGSPDPSLLL